MADNAAEQLVDGEPVNRAPRRSRFSLFTLLLLMTIAALGFGLWQVNRKYKSVVEPLQEELSRLQNESGQLFFSDPDKIYVRCAPALLEVNTWEWRIHLPPKRKYFLYVSNEICKTNIPSRDEWIGKQHKLSRNSRGFSFPEGEVCVAPSGEFMLRVGIRKDDRGRWQAKRRIFTLAPNGYRISQDSGQTQLFEDQFKWLEPGPCYSGGGELRQPQQVRDADQPIVLLRMVPRKNGKSPDPPCEGLMVWIEPEKPVASE